MTYRDPRHAPHLSRRRLLQGAAAGLGAAATLNPFRHAWGQSFPERNMQVVIPTGQGGGVDRTARAFTGIWSRYLDTNFEFSYHPGASGQVGYEVYLGRRDADCYNLLFGNIGPEMIMYVTQDPDYDYPGDYTYFATVNVDDAVIWVRNESPIQSIEDLVEEGRKRTVNLSTSRLPHPASIGVLALAEATGADFKLIPYGGGSKARSAAVTGEVDACATFMGSSVSLSDQIRFLTVFQDRNRLPKITNNAPLVNDVFDTSIPPLVGARAWAIHREAIERYPERFEVLNDSLRKVFDDKGFRKNVQDAGMMMEFFDYGDREWCEKTARNMRDQAQRFESLLTGTA